MKSSSQVSVARQVSFVETAKIPQAFSWHLMASKDRPQLPSDCIPDSKGNFGIPGNLCDFPWQEVFFKLTKPLGPSGWGSCQTEPGKPDILRIAFKVPGLPGSMCQGVNQRISR